MVRFLQSLFGLGEKTASRRPGEERRKKPRTSAASVLAGEHAKAAPAPPATAKPKPDTRPQAPDLSLEESDAAALDAQGDGSDPYDTGNFKRPDAWNRG